MYKAGMFNAGLKIIAYVLIRERGREQEAMVSVWPAAIHADAGLDGPPAGASAILLAGGHGAIRQPASELGHPEFGVNIIPGAPPSVAEIGPPSHAVHLPLPLVVRRVAIGRIRSDIIIPVDDTVGKRVADANVVDITIGGLIGGCFAVRDGVGDRVWIKIPGDVGATTKVGGKIGLGGDIICLRDIGPHQIQTRIIQIQRGKQIGVRHYRANGGRNGALH